MSKRIKSPMSPTPFYFLHITDRHIGARDDYQWTKHKEKFFSDLKWCLSGHPVHAVFYTGDIVYSGKVDQYETAQAELKEIYSRIAHRKEQQGLPIYLVTTPGNHDLERPDKEDKIHDHLISIRSDTSSAKFWSSAFPAAKQRLASFFHNYTDWEEHIYDCTGFKKPNLVKKGRIIGDFRYKIEHNNFVISVTTVNTSIFHLQDINKGDLLLAQAQLDALQVADGIEEEAHIKILLSHHPVDWLDNQNSIQHLIADRYHIHLTGHIHQSTAANRRRLGDKVASYHIGTMSLLSSIHLKEDNVDSSTSSQPKSVNIKPDHIDTQITEIGYTIGKIDFPDGSAILADMQHPDSRPLNAKFSIMARRMFKSVDDRFLFDRDPAIPTPIVDGYPGTRAASTKGFKIRLERSAFRDVQQMTCRIYRDGKKDWVVFSEDLDNSSIHIPNNPCSSAILPNNKPISLIIRREPQTINKSTKEYLRNFSPQLPPSMSTTYIINYVFAYDESEE